MLIEVYGRQTRGNRAAMVLTKRRAGRAVALDPVTTIILFIVVMAIQLLTASPARAASLSASPSSGPPGATVEISGTGFGPLSPVKLCWDGERCTSLGETMPDLTGGIRVDITIPGDADAGSHTIHACQRLLDLAWSCDSVGFDVIAPTTTTTTTTPPTTTTTAPTTTTLPTTTTQPRTTTTSPPAAPSSTSPPPATSAPASPGTSSTPAGVGGDDGVRSATTVTGSTTPLDGSPTTTRQATDSTTSTTTDDEASVGSSGYQPPDDGPRLPGDFGDGEAAALVDDLREGSVSGGGGEWGLALLAVVVAGITLWVADRVIRSDRRRYMLETAPRQR